MEFNYSKFLAIWQIIILGLAGISVLAGILIFIIHKLRLSSITNYKQNVYNLCHNRQEALPCSFQPS